MLMPATSATSWRRNPETRRWPAERRRAGTFRSDLRPAGGQELPDLPSLARSGPVNAQARTFRGKVGPSRGASSDEPALASSFGPTAAMDDPHGYLMSRSSMPEP